MFFLMTKIFDLYLRQQIRHHSCCRRHRCSHPYVVAVVGGVVVAVVVRDVEARRGDGAEIEGNRSPPAAEGHLDDFARPRQLQPDGCTSVEPLRH